MRWDAEEKTGPAVEQPRRRSDFHNITRSMFDRFDTDGSGHLDMQEFKLCAAGLNLPIGREARARVRLLAYKQCIDPAYIQVDFARAMHALGTMD